MPHKSADLRAQAQGIVANLPDLLIAAHHLAASLMGGAHGRRQAGSGEEFWQYRPAQQGDSYARIDWRRSARGDTHFIRQSEWQAAQSLVIAVHAGPSMTFTGDKNRASKLHRAQVLALALAILALRAGERVGLAHLPDPPRMGRGHIAHIATQLVQMQGTDDFTLAQIPQGGRVVVISDFLDDPAPIKALVASATQSHATGALMQVLDPVEEQFPFGGRTVFTSMTGAMRFETLQAKSLRHDYLARLAARKDQLRQITDRAGWAYGGHHTDDAPLPALLWMHQALGARA